VASALKCPNCDAENPEGAENCNLCFYRFAPTNSTVGTGPEAEVEKAPEPEQVAEPPSADTPEIPPDNRPPVKTIRNTALAGGAAAASGAWMILASFSVLHFLNIRAFDFLFPIMSVDFGKLSLFIVLLSLFGMLVGGIAGNVNDKRAIVPAARVVAAAIGLGLWAGLLQLFLPDGLALTDWLSSGWPGALATLAAFPLMAAAIGACESFGEEWAGSRALAGAIGGLAAGCFTAGLVANTYWIAPVFGVNIPADFWPVAIFGAKLVVITGLFSFIGGTLLWFAIISAEKVPE
jgi:hypothetical protein